MPLQTPSSKPDPNNPPSADGSPFTRLELAIARFVNMCADLRTTMEEAGALASAEAARRAEQAAADHARAKARIEQARRWVREHPDAL